MQEMSTVLSTVHTKKIAIRLKHISGIKKRVIVSLLLRYNSPYLERPVIMVDPQVLAQLLGHCPHGESQL